MSKIISYGMFHRDAELHDNYTMYNYILENLLKSGAGRMCVWNFIPSGKGKYGSKKMNCDTISIFRCMVMIHTAEFRHWENCSAHCPLTGAMSVWSSNQESVYM